MEARPTLRTADEIARIRDAGQVVHQVLEEVARAAVPGVTTAELDRLAEARTRALKARPAFLGYRGYPASLCISVNEEVIHGIPGPRVLQEGDVVGIDHGVVLAGWYADSARTVAVGQIDAASERLLRATRQALARGIAAARPGGHLGDIGHAVEAWAEAQGYSVVRDFVGHGVGRRLHEPPQVPNYGEAGTGMLLRPGLVLAIEPMVNAGGPEVRTLDDGWTAVTADGARSAHFEHTVAITEKGPENPDLARWGVDGRGVRGTRRRAAGHGRVTAALAAKKGLCYRARSATPLQPGRPSGKARRIRAARRGGAESPRPPHPPAVAAGVFVLRTEAWRPRT
ncbi:MAG: type I methionyl aminopeptidase [Anaeromyxobacter sp.]